MDAEIDISCSVTSPTVDVVALEAAMKHGLAVEEVESAVLSVTIVNNHEMHRLNRQHLDHDYPTDVLSFQLDWAVPGLDTPPATATGRSRGAMIEGEIIVSAEYAADMAPHCGWEAQDELTLYAIHGMLHICGYDDQTDAEQLIMRAREAAILNGPHPGTPSATKP